MLYNFFFTNAFSFSAKSGFFSDYLLKLFFYSNFWLNFYLSVFFFLENYCVELLFKSFSKVSYFTQNDYLSNQNSNLVLDNFLSHFFVVVILFL